LQLHRRIGINDGQAFAEDVIGRLVEVPALKNGKGECPAWFSKKYYPTTA
jgi:hypothetical protein